MNKLASRIKPKSGFSHFIHLFFTAIIPALVYVFVQWNFVSLALAIILLSKWRTLAVRPRHWWPNVRSNAVDISVGVATLVFMTQSSSDALQLTFAAIYGAWLIFLKPQSGVLPVSIQAIIGQTAGLLALYLGWGDQPIAVLVAMTGLITYVSARHFFTSFDEPHTALYSYTWAYFAASLAWLLSHWLLFYGVLAQIVLLLTVLGFGLAALYYLEQTDRLSTFLRRQFVFIMVAIIIVVLVFSDWGDQAI